MPRAHARPERIGHRGAPREVTENTLEGFLRALERGADAVELDVHKTGDGVVVVHHDPDVATTTRTHAPITSLSWEEVSRCRLSAGLHIPTLAAVLDGVGDSAMVYIELKGEGVGEAAVATAQAHGRRYAFHSFDHEAIRRLAARFPAIQRGVLFDSDIRDPIGALGGVDVRDIWAHRKLVSPALIDAVHERGGRLIAWTVNERRLALRMAEQGADGICTDDVRILEP